MDKNHSRIGHQRKTRSGNKPKRVTESPHMETADTEIRPGAEFFNSLG